MGRGSEHNEIFRKKETEGRKEGRRETSEISNRFQSCQQTLRKLGAPGTTLRGLEPIINYEVNTRCQGQL